MGGCMVTQGSAHRRVPMLGLILCNHCFKILNSLLTKGPAFFSALGFKTDVAVFGWVFLGGCSYYCILFLHCCTISDMLNHGLMHLQSLCLPVCSIHTASGPFPWGFILLPSKTPGQSLCLVRYHPACLLSLPPDVQSLNTLYTWVLYEYTTLLEPTWKVVESFVRLCLGQRLV